MWTPINCPNCGSTLAPGVTACARCGQKLAAPESSAPAVLAGPQFAPPRPATIGPQPVAPFKPTAILQDARERWNVAQTPYLSGALALAGLALLVGTLAHISYLISGTEEIWQQAHDAMWETLAQGLAFASAVVALLVRRRSGPTYEADVRGPDFRVAMVLVAITVLFALVGTVLGMGSRFAASNSWLHYSQMFAFLALAYLIISKPVPASFGRFSSAMIGLAVVVAAVTVLVVGQASGMSKTNNSFYGGIAWQATGLVVVTLALGWFLGMEPEEQG